MHLVLVSATFVLSAHLPCGQRRVIGRSMDADLTVEDSRVSRGHLAVVRAASGEITVEDLGSHNGTLLASTRLDPHCLTPWSPDEPCVLGRHVVWLEPESVRPRWVDEATFDEVVGRRSGAMRICEVRARVVSVSTETNDTGAVSIDASEDIESLLALRALLRHELARHGVTARDEAFVTRRGTGTLLVAVPATVSLATTDAPFVFEARSPAPTSASTPAKTSRSSPPPIAVGSASLDLGKVASSDATVLILGETGAGKEVMARALHERSPRATRRFVVVNCAAIAESLFEAELFGHEKGAFTGAIAPRPGYLESADGGTVLLDEIGELSRPLQAKLLRVFEDRSVQRVGSVSPRPIDVRFIAATHRDLAEDVSTGRFREDLYFRLCGVVVRVPPLRERKGELPRFAETLLSRLTPDSVRLSTATLDALLRHDWPGNVRELRAVLERALLLRSGASIDPEHLVFEYPAGRLSQAKAPTEAPPPVTDERRAKILAALETAHGNQTKAAVILGVSRRTLTNWLNELRIPRPRKGT
jgi:transcriptional regulator of acetoin/glycerol metabolism